MGIAERREREKEALRTRIVEAARDIVSEEGLDALSMRGIAERIEYSPATIYLHFRDKDELLREVVHEGFHRLGDHVGEEVEALGPTPDPASYHLALGRAYARFGIDNTAYFRIMFELPKVAHFDCSAGDGAEAGEPPSARSFCAVVESMQRAMDAGVFRAQDARKGAVIAWATIHGLTSLYLSGQLAMLVDSHEAFLELVESAMDTLGRGWFPRETGDAPAA